MVYSPFETLKILCLESYTISVTIQNGSQLPLALSIIYVSCYRFQNSESDFDEEKLLLELLTSRPIPKLEVVWVLDQPIDQVYRPADSYLSNKKVEQRKKGPSEMGDIQIWKS